MRTLTSSTALLSALRPAGASHASLPRFASCPPAGLPRRTSCCVAARPPPSLWLFGHQTSRSHTSSNSHAYPRKRGVGSEGNEREPVVVRWRAVVTLHAALSSEGAVLYVCVCCGVCLAHFFFLYFWFPEQNESPQAESPFSATKRTRCEDTTQLGG